MKFISHDDYIARLPADQQERIHAKAQKLKQAYELAQLRQNAELSQQALAAKMGVSQANISKIENGGDVQLSTLQKYVAALGGKLAITATMADGKVIAIV
ncbi:helix-turn-helix domain-containing protein [Neisseria leonii]|uniref:helix-turn-helix domain-containing protein n=1 Tax=Neisseria leonii TaxID=2995413 RepID=UPI00237A8853|nr:helix-turn-helix transcriptional regulator [Neisseria sp. 3986]MDD9325180.1 helix-turn-helix transcriptional regulator [Neisseria sp. 3986]